MRWNQKRSLTCSESSGILSSENVGHHDDRDVLGRAWLALLLSGKTMALLNCPECAHQVSGSAVACPHCGFPLQQPRSRQPVEPLRTPDGTPPPYNFDGHLEGVCPECSSRTTFRAAKFSELISAQAATIAKKGWYFSLAEEAFNLMCGAKNALHVYCSACNTRFFVCRECMKPNDYNSGREQHCDHCRKPMVT